MAAGARRAGGVWQLVIPAVVTPLIVVFGLSALCNGSSPILAMMSVNALAMSQPKLVYLKPGLRIGNKSPESWTHLVFKSIPQLATGDRSSLPAGSAKTATLFRSALLANVKPADINERDFELTEVGLGICIPDPQDEEHDIVVSADTLDALGLKHLTTVQRMVLDAAEEEMANGWIIARTATFALFRSPVTMLGPDGKHHKMLIHYALCVRRTTGKLDVAVWAMKPEAAHQQAPTVMVKLAPPALFNCELDVRARRILGTLPYSWSFAMRELPPGRKLRVSPALGALIVETCRHPAESDPEELERKLGEALASLPDGDVARDRDAATGTDAAVRRTAIPPPYQRSRTGERNLTPP